MDHRRTHVIRGEKISHWPSAKHCVFKDLSPDGLDKDSAHPTKQEGAASRPSADLFKDHLTNRIDNDSSRQKRDKNSILAFDQTYSFNDLLRDGLHKDPNHPMKNKIVP
jgi:hypothetical protein